MDLSRLQDRRPLNSTLNRVNNRTDLQGLDTYQQQAFDILTSNRLAKAINWGEESRSVLERYGKSQSTNRSFGGAPQSPQHLLLARRLIEAGARCVTVAFGAWARAFVLVHCRIDRSC